MDYDDEHVLLLLTRPTAIAERHRTPLLNAGMVAIDEDGFASRTAAGESYAAKIRPAAIQKDLQNLVGHTMLAEQIIVRLQDEVADLRTQLADTLGRRRGGRRHGRR